MMIYGVLAPGKGSLGSEIGRDGIIAVLQASVSIALDNDIMMGKRGMFWEKGVTFVGDTMLTGWRRHCGEIFASTTSISLRPVS